MIAAEENCGALRIVGKNGRRPDLQLILLLRNWGQSRLFPVFVSGFCLEWERDLAVLQCVRFTWSSLLPPLTMVLDSL
jgi:hypothetical protein